MRNSIQSLADIEVWSISLLVFASLVYERLLPVVIVVAVLFWVIRWIANGQLTRRTPIDLPVFLLILMIPVLLWVTVLPEITQTQVFRLLSGIVLYYAIVNWAKSYKRLYLVSAGLIFIGIGLAGFALISVNWGPSKLTFIPTSLYQVIAPRTNDTNNPNVVAGSLILLLPCTLAIMLSSWPQFNGLYRISAAVVTIVMIGVLLLTQSRGAWVALGLALIILMFLRWRWGWIGLVSVTILVAIVIYVYGSTSLLEVVTAGTDAGSLSDRVGVWSRALLLLRSAPFTGIGMGSFGYVMDRIFPISDGVAGRVVHAHNLFLQVALDGGIPTVICWLAVLWVGFATSWKVYMHGRKMYSRDNWITGMGAGLFCSQVALAVHGFTDAVTWGMVRPVPLVWALWGIAISFWVVHASSNKQDHYKSI